MRPYIIFQKVLMAGPMPIPVLVKLQATATITVDVEASHAFNTELSFDHFFGIDVAPLCELSDSDVRISVSSCVSEKITKSKRIQNQSSLVRVLSGCDSLPARGSSGSTKPEGPTSRAAAPAYSARGKTGSSRSAVPSPCNAAVSRKAAR